MNLEKVVIVASKSRYELELLRYENEEKARREYVSSVWENIKEGHLAQKQNLSKLEPYFYTEQVIDRSGLTPTTMNNHDAFVFLGGDNHFTYCSQVLLQYLQKNPQKEKVILGTVLDPKRSWGGQLYFTVDEFIHFLPDLEENDFKIENWTALETTVKKGEKKMLLYPAINEIFAGETKRWMMSRNNVYLDGKEIFPDKSSGILIATGSGSGPGSWYDNVHALTFDQSDTFPRTADYARVILTEHKSRSKITLEKGQVLTIYSSNDDAGIILPDSHQQHAVSFPMGTSAEIRISSVHLPIVGK